jgi:hypothetical protein
MPRRSITAALLAALSFMLLPALALADIKLQARVDKTTMALDDVLTLQVSVEARGNDAPEVTMPELDGFEIVSQQVQRPMQFSFNFGQGAVVQSQMIYTYGLRPTRVGNITIKPITAELGGDRRASAPITIAVSQGAGSAPNAPNAPNAASPEPGASAQPDEPGAAPANNVSKNGGLDLATVDGTSFIRAVADKATPFVGEQVTVTLYLYIRENLRAPPSVELEPTTDGFWVQDLLANQKDREQRQVVQGSVYAVYTLRRFAAFPLRSGELTIGPMELRMDTGSVLDIFGPRRGNQQLTRKSAPLVFQVKPLPERAAADANAAEPLVGRFEVDSKLDRAQSATGDAVTLTVTVRGIGNVRDAKLATPVIEGIDVLEPEVKDLADTSGDRVGGTRELRYLLVPRAPGRYVLPKFELSAFDPQTAQYRSIASTPLTLEVVGNAIAATATGATRTGADEPKDEAQAPKPVSTLEWRPIRTQSALARRSTLLADQPWFLPALGLPALVYAAWLVTRARQKRSDAREQTKQSRAEREARSKLEAATDAALRQDGKAFFAAAAGALLATLEARLGEPATGYTHGELRRYLLERGMNEALVRDVVGLLERADHARFGGASSAAQLDAELTALKAARDQLAGFTPTATEAA